MKTGILVIGALSVAIAAMGGQSDKPSIPATVVQQANVGLVASNTLVELRAVLAQVPPGDTVLEIRIVDANTIHVDVCDGDPTTGCRREYHKTRGNWTLGIIAHWTKDAPTRRRSLPRVPLGN